MHRGAAAPTEKAAVECILSSRLFFLGLTSHGIEPDVKCENIKCRISGVVPGLPGRRLDGRAAASTRRNFRQASRLELRQIKYRQCGGFGGRNSRGGRGDRYSSRGVSFL